MTTDSTQTSPRSRRALLAGAIGGLGVWAASAIGRAAPADAAAGDPIRMGRLNRASGSSTTLQTSTSQPALRAVQLGSGNALRAEATNGRAVMAVAGNSGTAVRAFGTNHYGVHADVGNGVAVFGDAAGSGQGVAGFSVNGLGLQGWGKVGLLASGWDRAADFEAPTLFWSWQDLKQISDPPAPTNNNVRVFARQNISGKQELCVRFETGAVQVIATEP
jgi:hypothetical protein